MSKITKGFAAALQSGVNQTGMLSAALNQKCSNCGKPLNNAQDPTSKQVGTKCLSCAYEDAEERKAS